MRRPPKVGFSQGPDEKPRQQEDSSSFRLTPGSGPAPTAPIHSTFGRVEDGCGSLGPMADAPFPIPAHRTGHTDFRYPTLRLASPQGTRRDTLGQALEPQQPEFSINNFARELARAAPCHFVSSREERKAVHAAAALGASSCPLLFAVGNDGQAVLHHACAYNG
jgi:hypothetical protein